MPKDITVDTSPLNRVVKDLADFQKQMPNAVYSAVNRTVDHVFTKTGRLVSSEYAIKGSDVKESLKKNKAFKGNLRASIHSKGRRLTFSHFRIGGSKKTVKVKIKKSEGMKKVSTNPKAFINTLTGKKQVMKRAGDKRLPIEVLRSISVPQMIQNTKITEEIQDAANKMLTERIDHEINRRLQRVGKK